MSIGDVRGTLLMTGAGLFAFRGLRRAYQMYHECKVDACVSAKLPIECCKKGIEFCRITDVTKALPVPNTSHCATDPWVLGNVALGLTFLAIGGVAAYFLWNRSQRPVAR